MPPCAHFLVCLVGFMVLDPVVCKLNHVQHEMLHLSKTYLACWIVLGKTLPCQILFPLLSWGCMPYVICNIPFLVLCTIPLLRVLLMMCGCLVYYEWILVPQVGLTVSGWNQIHQICGYRLIGGEYFLSVLPDLGWFLPVVIVFTIVEYESLCLWCKVPLWSIFLRFYWSLWIFCYMITWGH